MSDPAWDGPSKAEVERGVRAQNLALEAARKAEKRALWRRAHPEATCSDRVADLLIEMAESVGRA